MSPGRLSIIWVIVRSGKHWLHLPCTHFSEENSEYREANSLHLEASESGRGNGDAESRSVPMPQGKGGGLGCRGPGSPLLFPCSRQTRLCPRPHRPHCRGLRTTPTRYGAGGGGVRTSRLGGRGFLSDPAPDSRALGKEVRSPLAEASRASHFPSPGEGRGAG